VAAIPFYPLNDLAFTIALLTVESPDPTVIPLEGATVTGFFSNSDGSDGTAPAVVATPIAVTVVESTTAGTYLVTVDASALTLEACETNFGAGEAAFIILVQTSGIKTAVEMEYNKSRAAAAA
jgi:hypothetical protein